MLSDTANLNHLDIDDLSELLRSVNEVTEQLQTTHVALQEEAARLQRELAEANAQLRRSQALAALGEVAAGIAHEIRNPLGSIQLYAQMLGDDLDDRPQQQEICSRISRAVEGLDAIVRDVLLFARETRVHPAAVTAAELIHNALDNCACILMENSVEVESEIEGDIELEADSGLICLALSNVIRNAIEAMAEANVTEPGLTFCVKQQRRRRADGKRPQRIVMSIIDRGPGVPAEVIERMFNPFFTTRKTGTGLGLAIVHRIVDAHGGEVYVSDGPNGGACVELCLPPTHDAQQSSESPEVNVERLSVRENMSQSKSHNAKQETSVHHQVA